MHCGHVRADLAISTERTAVSNTAAIAEANSSFILCSSSCSPKLRMAALRQKRPFNTFEIKSAFFRCLSGNTRAKADFPSSPHSKS
jgi:hypothetical protein